MGNQDHRREYKRQWKIKNRQWLKIQRREYYVEQQNNPKKDCFALHLKKWYYVSIHTNNYYAL